MARPMETPGKPATERVTFRANEGLVAFIDRDRGTDSRSKYLRDLVRAEARRKAK